MTTLRTDRLRRRHKKYQRKYRKNNKEKVNARKIVFVALRNKTTTRLPCFVCSEIKSEAHHEDYSKPLEIIWLCKKHHVEADTTLRNKALSQPKI